MDEADLGHSGLEGAAADPVVDAHGLGQQAADLPPVVGREVAADPRPEVARLADVEDLASPIAEQVDARGARKVGGEGQLPRLGVAGHGGEHEEVVEPGDAERPGPLEQEVEEVAGGQGVVEGAVAGLVVEAEVAGEGAEPAVGDFVA